MPEERYRTLAIVPTTNLVFASDEAMSIVNLLHAELLQGNVTVDSVLSKLADGQWDIIWFVTHGDENGILLSDGPLSASTLTTLIRTSNAWLVVLNTCASLSVALKIHNELLTDLVCTIKQVPDLEAYVTAKQFAIQLGRGLEPHRAYLLAKPGQNENYIYLVGQREHAMPPPVGSSGSQDSEPTLRRIWDELQRLILLIDGGRGFGPGLADQVRALQKVQTVMIQEMEERFNKIELSVNRITFIVILLSVLDVFLLIMMGSILLLK